MSAAISEYGWVSKPRDPKIFLEEKLSRDPAPQTLDSIRLPDTPLAKKVLEYAKQELNDGTFNHSMRVFYYGKSFSILSFSSQLR